MSDATTNNWRNVHHLLVCSLVCFQNMIDLSLSTPIQDVSVYQFPLDLVSSLLQEVRSQLRATAMVALCNISAAVFSDCNNGSFSVYWL